VSEAREAQARGLGGLILFGIPEKKDDAGSGAYQPDGVVQEAVAAVKAAVPGLFVVTDVCLCEYTRHGHCGILKAPLPVAGPRRGAEDDPPAPAPAPDIFAGPETLAALARTAVSHARAGADMVAPSAMMDGQVAAIRAALDADGFGHIPIMSYSVKYASSFYGPFRDAAQSAPAFGDRRSYQMDPANRTEALREAGLDIAEGADLIMVKPALAFLDILALLKERFDVPVAAYNVSGEYAMVKAAGEKQWIDEKKAALEILTGIRRAGADLIITYHALDAARWLKGGAA
jgi:porphobilinogen synthase